MSQAPDITGTEGERLDATVTVDSTFSGQQTQTIELRIEDGGTTVHTDSQGVTLADSTDSQQITLSWPTGSGDKGVYDLFIESDQDTIQRLVEVQSVLNTVDHRWQHDEGSGSTLADTGAASTALDGTLNGPNWATGTGSSNAYLEYDASNTERTQLPFDARAELSHWVRNGTGTLFAWVRPDSLTTSGGDKRFILGNSIGSKPNIALTTTRWQVDTDNGTSAGMGINYGGDIVAGDWQSIAIRADGATCTAYVSPATGSLTQVGTDTIGDTQASDLETDVQFGVDRDGPSSDNTLNTRWYDGGIDYFVMDSADLGEQFLEDLHNDTKADYQ
jgi:hypothetical protein